MAGKKVNSAVRTLTNANARRETAAERPAPARRPGRVVADHETWEAQHKRFTVWADVEVLEALDAEVRATGESKASFVDRALRSALGM